MPIAPFPDCRWSKTPIQISRTQVYRCVSQSPRRGSVDDIRVDQACGYRCGSGRYPAPRLDIFRRALPRLRVTGQSMGAHVHVSHYPHRDQFQRCTAICCVPRSSRPPGTSISPFAVDIDDRSTCASASCIFRAAATSTAPTDLRGGWLDSPLPATHARPVISGAPIADMHAPMIRTRAPMRSIESPTPRIGAPIQFIGARLLRIDAPMNFIGARVVRIGAPMFSIRARVVFVGARRSKTRAPTTAMQRPMTGIGACTSPLRAPTSGIGEPTAGIEAARE